VNKSDLCKLLKAINHPAGSKEVVSVQGYLCSLNKWREMPEAVSEADFAKYYAYYSNKSSHEKNNALLVRPMIEKSKLPTRKLMPGGFSYGKTEEKDAEGAGLVVLTWKSGERSESGAAGKSMLKINKAAVTSNHVTAKQVNQFLKEHADDPAMQCRKVVGKKTRGKMKPPKPKAKKQADNAPMSQILFPGKTNINNVADRDYVDISNKQVAGRLPIPRQTHSSNLIKSHISQQTSSDAEDVKLWKMNRFSSVEAKLSN